MCVTETCLPNYTPLLIIRTNTSIATSLSLVADSGAIPFILGGANIMCPGLVNPGSELNEGYEVGQSVVVYAEGKEHAIAVGHLKVRERRNYKVKRMLE